MNVIGETLTILASTDPTQVGKKGRVVLDTANTLLLESEGSITRIAKSGATFKLQGAAHAMSGLALSGRLQDRLGRGRR